MVMVVTSGNNVMDELHGQRDRFLDEMNRIHVHWREHMAHLIS